MLKTAIWFITHLFLMVTYMIGGAFLAWNFDPRALPALAIAWVVGGLLVIVPAFLWDNRKGRY